MNESIESKSLINITDKFESQLPRDLQLEILSFLPEISYDILSEYSPYVKTLIDNSKFLWERTHVSPTINPITNQYEWNIENRENETISMQTLHWVTKLTYPLNNLIDWTTCLKVRALLASPHLTHLEIHISESHPNITFLHSLINCIMANSSTITHFTVSYQNYCQPRSIGWLSLLTFPKLIVFKMLDSVMFDHFELAGNTFKNTTFDTTPTMIDLFQKQRDPLDVFIQRHHKTLTDLHLFTFLFPSTIQSISQCVVLEKLTLTTHRVYFDSNNAPINSLSLEALQVLDHLKYLNLQFIGTPWHIIKLPYLSSLESFSLSDGHHIGVFNEINKKFLSFWERLIPLYPNLKELTILNQANVAVTVDIPWQRWPKLEKAHLVGLYCSSLTDDNLHQIGRFFCPKLELVQLNEWFFWPQTLSLRQIDSDSEDSVMSQED